MYTLLMQQRHLQRQRLHRSLPIRKTKKDNKDDEEDLKEVLSSKISKAADEEVGKEETVYVVADNSGKAKDVIVSDWLKNPDGNETIEDVSDLKDIKNVKGKEKFEEKRRKDHLESKRKKTSIIREKQIKSFL